MKRIQECIFICSHGPIEFIKRFCTVFTKWPYVPLSCSDEEETHRLPVLSQTLPGVISRMKEFQRNYLQQKILLTITPVGFLLYWFCFKHLWHLADEPLVFIMMTTFSNFCIFSCIL